MGAAKGLAAESTETKGSVDRIRYSRDIRPLLSQNCFACHAPAREPWDFVCESKHGCEPIPIDHKMTGALQRSDPRCGDAQPEPGDAMALWKLRALVAIGATVSWFKSFF